MVEEIAVSEQIRGLPGMQVIRPEGDIFEDSPSERIPIGEPEKTAKADKSENTPRTNDGDEIVDELEYLEKRTGFKSWDEVKALKTEAEQLRSKAQTSAERKFANERSKQLAEAWEAGETDKVFEFLNTERQLKRAAELPAAAAIKLHLQQTNPHYKPEDVEDVFEERYSIPKKPVQGVAEDIEDFNDRMTEYTTRVAKVNRAIERDAVAAKADLANRITELVPPEIPKRNEGNQGPSQEGLEARKAFIDGFVKAIPKELENFKGFNTVFKDDAVEIPISYGITPEEVKAYQGKLEAFANANLDVNTLFTERWVNKDGTVNASKAAADLYVLDNLEKILQKVATESGNKRLAHHIKLNSNINVKGETKVVTMDKTEKGSQAEAIGQLWEQA